MTSVSLLIPSTEAAMDSIRQKKDETWRKYASEMLIDYTWGISRSRNMLASRAAGDILCYFDDDTVLSEEWWAKIITVKPGQIYMAKGIHHPISRVMSITKETLKELGGFDKRIVHNCEDYDLFLRAQAKGMEVLIIPESAIGHANHPGRNPITDAMDSAYVIVKNGVLDTSFFMVKNPVRLLFRALGLIYYTLKGV